MPQFSEEARQDILKQSLIFGVIMGACCIPFTFFGSSLGMCCPFANLLAMVPVIFAGSLGGFLAAMFLDWRSIPAKDAMLAGVQVGAITAAVASFIGGGATLAMSLMGIATWASDASSMSGETLSFFGTLVAGNMVSLLFGIAIAMIFGIVGGIIGAAIKRPAS